MASAKRTVPCRAVVVVTREEEEEKAIRVGRDDIAQNEEKEVLKHREEGESRIRDVK